MIASDKQMFCGDGWLWAHRFIAAISLAIFLFPAGTASAADRQFVQGHLPEVIASQQPIGRVSADTRKDIAFALPLRNRLALTNWLRQVYQRGNPAFHHYLTPGEFTANYGPTEGDYQSVIRFATVHGLKITGTHANRTLLDVNGAVGDIEQALHVHINRYRHPTGNRTFFAPDAQPSIDLETPVLAVGGLHNFTLPHACVHAVPPGPSANPQPQSGSGPSQTYFGPDFRAAYAPGVSLTGTGQAVGLFELDGYNVSDITNYETMANITPFVPMQNVLIDGFSGVSDGGGATIEECLDIEMAVAMAPGLTNVVVYEGNPNVATAPNDVLNRMATDDQAAQLSCSYVFDTSPATDQIFLQMAAQGQSFFQASGDYDAYAGPAIQPADDPNITVVGGTFLNTTGPAGSWVGESVWNDNNGTGSSGGFSTVVPIPFWQQSVSMAGNSGSTTMRNLPDVAMLGYGIWVDVTGGTGEYQGTSIAAPLWAAFTALVNEQAALNGQAPLGFANPAIYAIGQGANYANCFHDITSGNNTSGSSPGNFFAVPGFDLCTGWGTPAGSNLISALLLPADALVIAPAGGFVATGPIGGPFNLTTTNYFLTNAGAAPLNWTLANTAPWLNVSPAGGTLAPDGPATTVTVSLNSVASNYLMGQFTGMLAFTNLQDNAGQSWPVGLYVGNGGFETGDFSYWTLSGDTNYNYAADVDDSQYPGVGDILPGIPYSDFVHSGSYGAFLGQSGSDAMLSQTLPTVLSQYYLLSCWFSSLADNGATTPNEFFVQWNGSSLYDQTNLGAFGWSNLQFIVTATGSATALVFGFRDDPGAFALDDVTVQTVPAPAFQAVTQSNGVVSFTWNALAGLVYQLQYTTNLDTTNWTNLGPPVTAATNVVTAADTNAPDAQRFYRFVLSP